MATSDDMQAFQGLSYGEKWRVARFLAKGEAPQDPRMAVAAVELAESNQRQGRVVTTLVRWLPVAVIIGGGAAAVHSAASGDVSVVVVMALVVLVNVAHLMLNPMTRPQKVTRSLEASRRISAAGS